MREIESNKIKIQGSEREKGKKREGMNIEKH